MPIIQGSKLTFRLVSTTENVDVACVSLKLTPVPLPLQAHCISMYNLEFLMF